MAKKSKGSRKSRGSRKSKGPKTFMFQPNNKYLDSKSTLQLNYNAVPIKDTDVKENSKTLSIVYYNSPYPTMSYPKASDKYNAIQIRICGVLHKNVKNVTCDSKGKSMIKQNNIVGEMIVENTSASGLSRIYTCFLLKQNKTLGTNNDIDNVINNHYLSSNSRKDSVSLDLYKYITNSQEAYVYSSGNDTVIVFSNPIIINSSYKHITQYKDNITLFKTKPADRNSTYRILSYKSNTKSAKKIETDTNGIYIDCKPTGESDSKIAAYNVPINSEYTRNAAKIDFMKTTIQLCFVIIMMLVIYFAVPFFYKAAVIDSVNRLLHDTSKKYDIEGLPATGVSELDKNRFVRIRTADTLIMAYFFIIFGLLLHKGFKGNKFDLIMWALYVSLMFGLGFSTVQFSKTNREFMNTKIIGEPSQGRLYPDELDNEPAPNYLFFKDFANFLAQAFKFIFSSNKMYNLIIMLFMACLTLFILVMCKLAKSIKTWSYMGSIFLYVCVFIIIPIVPTFLLTLTDKNGNIKNLI